MLAPPNEIVFPLSCTLLDGRLIVNGRAYGALQGKMEEMRVPTKTCTSLPSLAVLSGPKDRRLDVKAKLRVGAPGDP
ncbi:hypothetical protein B0H13DRAFT_2369333 [Mycena leptocephala]|nr:hypothetical protein B0H13DRAFT_2369333 [Mycena leptocephala]